MIVNIQSLIFPKNFEIKDKKVFFILKLLTFKLEIFFYNQLIPNLLIKKTQNFSRLSHVKKKLKLSPSEKISGFKTILPLEFYMFE